MVATVCHELQRATGHGVQLDESAIPVRDPVQSVCDILGYDPMYLACEGRVVAVIDPETADRLLQRWQDLPNCGRPLQRSLHTFLEVGMNSQNGTAIPSENMWGVVV